MLDIIVTVSAKTPAAWARQAVDSVNDAINAAPFHANIVLAEGVPGHIGRAMAAGFAQSAAPYVAWVDDDDYLLPDALRAFGPVLQRGAAAVFGRSLELMANGYLKPNHNRHHLSIYARDVVRRVPLADHASIPNVHLIDAGTAAGGVDLLSYGYVHRTYRSAAMALRAGNYQ